MPPLPSAAAGSPPALPPTTALPSITEALDTITWLFQHYGSADYVGEPVSQQEHALQTAHFARQDRPHDPGFYVAALLHDVGHLLGLWVLDEKARAVAATNFSGGHEHAGMISSAAPPEHVRCVLEAVMGAQHGESAVRRMGDVGIASHEHMAARFCRRIGLPERVGVVASLHVDAKRYLCCVDET